MSGHSAIYWSSGTAQRDPGYHGGQRQAVQVVAQKKHTSKTKDGPRLVLWSENGQSLQMPIVTSATYLGIKVSYQNFEKLTLAHRLAAANAQRARLLKILHHNGISVRRRLQLWVTCVRSAALYGLRAVGMGQKQIDRLTIVLTKHVRVIVGSFAHMYKDSSRNLYSRLAIPDPLELYKYLCLNTLETARASADPMVNCEGTLAWLAKFCLQSDCLTSHLNHHPCTSHSEPTSISMSGEGDGASGSLPRPLQGAEAGRSWWYDWRTI